MKRLHVYMIKSYLGPFIFTFFITVFLLLMQFLWKYIDEFVGKGLDIFVILELMAYASASFIPMALPLAILLSSIMTFGNLGEHYELVALKSSGISLTRIMMPLIAFSVFLSVAAFGFSNYYLPYANLKFYSLLFDVREQRPEIIIREGIFYNGIDDVSIRISGKNQKTKTMYGVFIFDHRQRAGNNVVIIADSARMDVTPNKQYVILDLFSGIKYEEVRQQNDEEPMGNYYPHQIDEFSSQRITIELEGFAFTRTDESLFKEHYHMLSLTQLQESIDSLNRALTERETDFSKSEKKVVLEKTSDSAMSMVDTVRFDPQVAWFDTTWSRCSDDTRKAILASALSQAQSKANYIRSTREEFESRQTWIAKHEIQWHLKFSLSVACFILFFIGAPLGAIIRKGGFGLPVVVSVLFFVFYYVISITGEKFAKEGIVAPIAGVWVSSAILLPIGIFLTYKASRESSLFNIEVYLKPLNKVVNFVLRKKNVPEGHNENTPAS